MRTIKLLTTMLTVLALTASARSAEAQGSARVHVSVTVVQVGVPFALLRSTATELAARPAPTTRMLPAGARARVSDREVPWPADATALQQTEPRAQVRTITFEYVAN